MDRKIGMLARTTLPARKWPGFSVLPDFIAASAADIDFEYLRDKGIKACFIDLDGTVVAKNAYTVNPGLIAKLRDHSLPIYIATNRPRRHGLKNLKKDLSAVAVIHPRAIFWKPSKRYYSRALRDNGLRPGEVVMIGDRYIQDIIGANRSGLYTLVVSKIGPATNKFDAALSNFEAKLTTSLIENSGEYTPLGQ